MYKKKFTFILKLFFFIFVFPYLLFILLIFIYSNNNNTKKSNKKKKFLHIIRRSPPLIKTRKQQQQKDNKSFFHHFICSRFFPSIKIMKIFFYRIQFIFILSYKYTSIYVHNNKVEKENDKKKKALCGNNKNFPHQKYGEKKGKKKYIKFTFNLFRLYNRFFFCYQQKKNKFFFSSLSKWKFQNHFQLFFFFDFLFFLFFI